MSGKKEFRRMLLRIAEQGVSARRATVAFRKALLDFGSETGDNKLCALEIGVGTYKDRYRGIYVTGLALRRQRRFVSEILNDVEGIPIPSAVSKRYPGITQKEFDAILRLATLVFISLEKDR